VLSLREINTELKKPAPAPVSTGATPGAAFYPPDERAGFNFGKAICALIESLRVNETDFLRGLLRFIETSCDKKTPTFFK